MLPPSGSPDTSADPAVDYLRCLVAAGQVRAAGASEAELAQAFASLIVEHCADIHLALVYRAEPGDPFAALEAFESAEAHTEAFPARVALPMATSSRQDDADDTRGSCIVQRMVVALDADDAARPRRWLRVEGDAPASAARTLFVQAMAQALAWAIRGSATQKALQSRADALASREEVVSGFVGDICDEIRTALTLLLAPLQTAVDHYDAPSLKAALDEGHRLRRLSDALSDLADIDAGRIDPLLQPIDIAAMTRDVASLFHGAATAAGVVLTIACPPLPGPVQVDRLQWEQVVINLLGNAIRFTRNGEVRVRLRAQVGLMTLEVSDTGRGIHPDELSHVFDRFHRGRDRHERGLSLAVVRELVRLQGGDIEATSSPGQGSCFRVCIPMLDRSARPVPHRYVTDLPMRMRRRLPSDASRPTEAHEREVAAKAAAGAPAPGRESIAVLVDHAGLADYLCGLFEMRYRVDRVTLADDPVEALRTSQPDLVVVDLGRTDSRGLAFIRRLRASSRGGLPPALLLTSNPRGLAHSEALASGADDVIDKPFTANELLARVDAHMHLSRERRALHRRLIDHNRDLEAQVARRTSALAASEAQFKAISNLVPDILWRSDAQGRVEWRSEQWTRFTGGDDGAAEMNSVHPDDRAAAVAWVRETVAGERQAPHEFRLRRHDGAYHWFVARMSAVTGREGVVEHWFGSATDIEPQQLARHALELQVDEGSVALARAVDLQQELLQQLSRSQEDERRRIARELHDSLGQYLTALKLALSALAPTLADPQLRELVQRLDALTTEVDRELDDIIAALRPVVLDELGIAGALPGIVADWSRQSGVAAEVLVLQMGEERFDDESESTLYRVTQESLTNIVKHAGARNVAVTLTRRQSELHLSIEDDGAGFDTTRHPVGWGLRGMAERVRSVGGLLQVESRPQAGTTVLARLPCRSRDPAPPPPTLPSRPGAPSVR